jgi:glycerophosphoryl diester phosphodiesterase
MPTTDFMVIAHRGASSYAPENTLAAFDLALHLGCRHIELDVDFTSDGHIVVLHDDAVDRTTNGTGPVGSHTLAELQSLDAGAWFGPQFMGERIPTFAEVLERYRGRAHIHTEIKGRAAHLAQSTADLVRQHAMADHVTVTSFQQPRLEEMRAYAPELPTGWLVSEVSDATIAQARALGLTQMCPRANTVTPALVRRLHAEGFVVRAWGVADEALRGMKTASRFLSTSVFGGLAMCCLVVTGCTSTRTVVEPPVEAASPSSVVDPSPPTGPPPGYVEPTNYWVREKIILTSAQEPSASATQKSAVSKGKKSKKTGKRVTE